MMTKLTQWFHREDGVSEAATAIFVLPIIAFMIFSLLEAGMYLSSRSQFDQIVQSTVRNVALDGGWNNTRSKSITSDWVTRANQQLDAACNGGPLGPARIRCSGPAVISCTPDHADTLDQIVSCTGTFKYKPVSPLSTNAFTSLGFSQIYVDSSGNYKTVTSTSSAFPATSWNG